jgi:N utilization substance protein A
VILPRDQVPREAYRQGDRIRAYVMDIKKTPKGPQILLSRTHPGLLIKLFELEVPEISEGIVKIEAAAREPGGRAKIAVSSRDPDVDPVGACVGMKGSRVQAVVQELRGEKIDIVPYSEDPVRFVVNALAPAEVAKVVMDEEQRRIEVVVPDEQLSLAIGRRGQNVRLASQLTGWDIDILTEAEESERRTEEFRTRSQMFIDALDVDDVIAHLLVTEGFTSVEEVAYVPLQEQEARRIELGVEDAVMELPGMTLPLAVALGEKGLKTLDDVGDLAGDELIELAPASAKPTQEEADAIIMAARAHWFENEPAATEAR